MHAERMARREQMRAQWNALSDEEKQARRKAMRAHREERRAMWESMSPEERAAIRERRGDRHHGRQDQE
jgi:TRAP-type C4-dicarboxylate transport system substrate-binding protein